MRALVALTALLALPLAAPIAAAQDGAAAKDPRNYTWVEEGVLAVGGGGLTEPDVEWLAANGFTAIADFRAEHKDPEALIAAKNMTFFDMPVESAGDINETQLAQFVAWAREQRAAGRVMYIHCTNGWHRAAAFAVAWEMAETGDNYEEAAREAAARRPGTVMRAVAGLLDYESSLTGKPQLAVALVSPLSHPGLNGTMPVTVEVYANGAPAVGASVRVWSEESRIRLEGTTDANGTYTFTYVAPSSAFMDHLYARASLDGLADGADDLDFIFQHAAKERGPLDVVAERMEDGLRVRATSEGKPVPVRVIVNAPGFSEFEASDRGEVLIPHVPRDAIAVRVVSWGALPGTASVAAIAPPPPPPEPEPEPPVVAPPRSEPPLQEQPPPELETPPALPPAPAAPPESSHALALRYATMAAAGAAALGLYLVLSRNRSGVGRR